MWYGIWGSFWRKGCSVASNDGRKLEAKTQDALQLKTCSLCRRKRKWISCKVGKDAKHPMLEVHYIEFIEIIVDGINFIENI